MTSRLRGRYGSDHARAWVRSLHLGNPYAKCILMAVATYADENGCAYPGIGTLHQDTEIAENTIIARLRWSETVGLVTLTKCWVDENGQRNKSGRGRPTSMEIRFMFDADIEAIEAAAREHSGERPLRGWAKNRAEISAASHAEQIHEPSSSIAPQQPCTPCGQIEEQEADVGVVRAREEKISPVAILPEAISLAEEIAAIAGLADPEAWPPDWCGTATIVDAWLREGYTADDLRTGAQMAMAGKRDGPPRSAKYFKWAWPKARGMRESPVPAADQTTNVRRTNIRDKWRERTENAFAELEAYIDANADDKAGSGRPGEESAERLSLAKPP